MPIQTKNPATEEVIKVFDEISEDELEFKLGLAQQAYVSWRETPITDRARLMLKLSDYLKANKDEIAKYTTIEMGKHVSGRVAEVEKSALACSYYAENGESLLKDEVIQTSATLSYVSFEPLGVVLGVMPWNFPFWQVFRGAAPALMAGNVMVVKHASNVPMCAEIIEKCFLESGFPPGVYQNLRVGSDKVERIIRDKRIAAITLTGSEKAGSEVAKIAGSELKKVVLELGGSDPFIVFPDADVDLAVELGATSRISNNVGQACNSAKRFIVFEEVYDQFITKLTQNFKGLVVGDPEEAQTSVGPLATAQILKDVTEQVAKSVSIGAKVMLGGGRHGDKGYFYLPTVLADVTKGMPVYDEEVFGPVASVIKCRNVDEAIEIANDTPYGLGATLITSDVEEARKIAKRIEAGNVFINAQVRSDPRLPFGGIKKSGYGRELGSYGIKEFVNIKTIFVK